MQDMTQESCEEGEERNELKQTIKTNGSLRMDIVV